MDVIGCLLDRERLLRLLSGGAWNGLLWLLLERQRGIGHRLERIRAARIGQLSSRVERRRLKLLLHLLIHRLIDWERISEVALHRLLLLSGQERIGVHLLLLLLQLLLLQLLLLQLMQLLVLLVMNLLQLLLLVLLVLLKLLLLLLLRRRIGQLCRIRRIVGVVV